MTTAFAAIAEPMDADNVRVGDDILFLGHLRRVHAITPYVSDTNIAERKAWRVASDAYGWSMTLIPGDRLEVIRW